MSDPNDNKVVFQLTQGEIEGMMTSAVDRAFVRLGIDASDPLEMQRDFQHLRDWRMASSSAKRYGIMAILGVLITGTLGALWLGIRVGIQDL